MNESQYHRFCFIGSINEQMGQCIRFIFVIYMFGLHLMYHLGDLNYTKQGGTNGTNLSINDINRK